MLWLTGLLESVSLLRADKERSCGSNAEAKARTLAFTTNRGVQTMFEFPKMTDYWQTLKPNP